MTTSHPFLPPETLALQHDTLSVRLEGADNNDLLDYYLRRSIPCTPFAEGNLRFDAHPCILTMRNLHRLHKAAESACLLYDELCDIALRNQELLQSYFGLTQAQNLLWAVSGGQWHGIARADLFFKTDGSIVLAELNSDTPSGMDEAFMLGSYAAERWAELHNPNAILQEHFTRLVFQAFAQLAHPLSQQPTVGLIYPTDIPEDLGLISLYRTWLEQSGCTVLIASPFNIDSNKQGRATVLGQEIDILIRHYKTDWWCERPNVWKDARSIPDAQPMYHIVQKVVEPMLHGKLAVLNPFGAILTQNKKTMAFFHEYISLFSAEAQQSIRSLIPYTRRFCEGDENLLLHEKNRGVLTSDYGCEGAEVVVGAYVKDEIWQKTLELALPQHWIVQEFFEVEKDAQGLTENYGVYVVDGIASGVYLRVSKEATNASACAIPVVAREMLSESPLYRESRGVQAHTLLSQDAVLTLLKAYTPTPRWLPFRMPLLLYSAGEDYLRESFNRTPSVEFAYNTGKVLSFFLKQFGQKEWSDTLFICDLYGEESAAFCAAFSDVAEVIIQLDNIAHAQELVPMRKTLSAIQYYAGETALNQALHNHQTSSAILLLDVRRLHGEGDFNANIFDNRHWAFLPVIDALRQRGIAKIFYIHADSVILESDDMNEDFVQYHLAGFQLHSASLSMVQEHMSNRTLSTEQLLEATSYIPQRRETMFSYITSAVKAPEKVEAVQPQPFPYQHVHQSTTAER